MRRRRRGVSGIDPTLACWIPMTSKYAVGQTLTDLVAGNNAPASGNPVIGADYTTFDGSGDWFTIPSSFNTTMQGNWSVCIWIKPDDGQPAGVQAIFGNDVDTNGRDIATLTTAGKISSTHRANGDSHIETTDSAVFPNGATDWTHITVTGDADVDGTYGDVKIYKNGVLEATTNTGLCSAINWAQFNSTEAKYYLGNNNGADNYLFTGKQKDFRIYNRIITTTEMLAIVAAG